MVEFTLVFPILAMLVLGLFSSAMAFDARMQLTHATREGARHGATLPQSQAFTSGNWASNVRNVVIEREGGQLAPADVCVALVAGSPAVPVTPDHTTQSGGGACFDDTASGVAERRVQVSTRRSMPIDAVFVTPDVSITSRATMRHETNS